MPNSLIRIVYGFASLPRGCQTAALVPPVRGPDKSHELDGNIGFGGLDENCKGIRFDETVSPRIANPTDPCIDGMPHVHAMRVYAAFGGSAGRLAQSRETIGIRTVNGSLTPTVSLKFCSRIMMDSFTSWPLEAKSTS